MKLVLAHHAEAESPAVDPQRPLTSHGRAQAGEMAERARLTGFVPAAIWHSGKLRARQTAEAYLRALNPFAEFRMVRGLGPDDPPVWMRDQLAAETSDVMVVGHMPNISDLARALAGPGPGVPLHGFLLLERMDDGRFEIRLEIPATSASCRDRGRS